jgi:tetratricopeptide (TPR) repeat protein
VRQAGRIGTAAALAVAAFLLAGVGLFRGVVAQTPPSPRRPDAAALSRPAVASGTLQQELVSLQEHLRAAPTDWRGFASLGLAYVQEARITADPSYYPKAEAALRRSLRLNSNDNHVAPIGMAALASARHDFARALAWGQKAKAIDPYDASVYGAIGDAQVELGRYRAAVATFQRMIDLRPDLSSWARVSYARELMGDVPGAIDAMRRAKVYGSDPADAAWASNQLGELFFGQGHLGRAAVSYRQGAMLDPSFVPPFAGLAKVAWARGDVRQAISRYRDVVARYPLPEYVIALGDLYRLTGRTALAAQQDGLLRTEETLLAANGVNLDLEQATFDASHGDPAGGLAAAEGEWARRHSVSVADAMAWALHENGRDAEAARMADFAMHLGTKSAAFAFHAGMIQRSLGHPDRARTLLQRAHTLNPWFSIEYARVLHRALARLGPER